MEFFFLNFSCMLAGAFEDILSCLNFWLIFSSSIVDANMCEDNLAAAFGVVVADVPFEHGFDTWDIEYDDAGIVGVTVEGDMYF